jgi:ferric-dicitrate binding protein FerR (iron transport regulator)
MALRDVPLRRALAEISRDTGAKITVATKLADLTVDADFADPIPLEAALRLLAEQVGGTVERTPDGAYRVMEVR